MKNQKLIKKEDGKWVLGTTEYRETSVMTLADIAGWKYMEFDLEIEREFFKKDVSRDVIIYGTTMGTLNELFIGDLDEQIHEEGMKLVEIELKQFYEPRNDGRKVKKESVVLKYKQYDANK